MLSIQKTLLFLQYTSRLYAVALTFSSLTFICVSPVSADESQSYRNEPITPIPLTIDVNTAKAQLGEKLYFDRRLSDNNTVACASCHQLAQGGDDNVATGFSMIAASHDMNTPTVFNAAFNFRQNWDGSATTLAQQIEMVMQNQHEFNSNWSNVMQKLGKDSELLTEFAACYSDGLTRKNVIDALVEFEKTLITPNSRFDRYLRYEENSLTQEEIEGYTLFKSIGCISCHQGRNVGGNLFQKFGIFYDYIAEQGEIHQHDYGRYNTSGREMDKFVFKVPSLRNIAVTAPYLHDGSAEKIEDAIGIMGKTQLGKILSDREVSLIKSFLLTLTGEYKNISLDDRLINHTGAKI